MDTQPRDTRKKRALAIQRVIDDDAPLAIHGCSTTRCSSQPAKILRNRGKIERLLRTFSSPRKRLGLTPDELLIFFAIGYLGTTFTDGAIQKIPIGLVDVSTLLGIPKETVRRKATRLVDIDYLESTPKGLFVKELKVWSQMLERALT